MFEKMVRSFIGAGRRRMPGAFRPSHGPAARAAAVLLSVCVAFTMTPMPTVAAVPKQENQTGLCEHHKAHTDECGYQEAEPGHPCEHEHTEGCYTDELICGFIEGEDATASDSDAKHVHTQDCHALDCPHENGVHDGDCNYMEEKKGIPCGYVCEFCEKPVPGGNPGNGMKAVTLVAFDGLDEGVEHQSVPAETPLEELVLPETLSATARTGDGEPEPVTVQGVIWEPDALYEGKAGSYDFTASAAGYTCAQGVDWPVITVTVEKVIPTPDEIDALCAAIDALPTVDEIFKNAPGDLDPEYDAWVTETSGKLAEVPGLWKQLSAFLEDAEVVKRITDARVDKLAALNNLAERMTERRTLVENVVEVIGSDSQSKGFFPSLLDAVNSAVSGDTLKVIQDMTVESALMFSGKDITLDLQGKKLRCTSTSSSSFILFGTASLRVTGTGMVSFDTMSTIVSPIENRGTGTVTIEGGTFSCSGEGALLWNKAGGHIIVNGGILSVNGKNAKAIRNGAAGTVTIQSGTVSAEGDSAAAIDNTGNISIEGGTVSATGATATAILQGGVSKVTVNGNAKVTSDNTSQGTIYLTKVPSTTPKTILEVTGGTVENTADNGYAVYFKENIGVISETVDDYFTRTDGTINGKIYPEPRAAHNHCVCGSGSVSTGGHTSHSSETWMSWASNNSLPTAAGNYYLVENVTLTDKWTAPAGEVKICLNGKTVTAAHGNDKFIVIPRNGSLTITDCQGNGGMEFTSDSNSPVAGIYGGIGSNFSLYGGSIKLNKNQVYSADALHNSGGTFAIHGGKVSATHGSTGADMSPNAVGVATAAGVTTLWGGSFEAKVTNSTAYSDGETGAYGAFVGNSGVLRLAGEPSFTVSNSANNNDKAAISVQNYNLYACAENTPFSGDSLNIKVFSEARINGGIVVREVEASNKDKFSVTNVSTGFTLNEVTEDDKTHLVLMGPYYVKFNSNGGTGNMENQDFTGYTDSKALTRNAYTKNGFRFTGWNTAWDGTGTPYADGATVFSLAYGGYVILHAQWEELPESSDATLSALTYTVGSGSATDVPNFAADTTTYNVPLPYGTSATASITLTGTPNDSKASITANEGVTLSGGIGTAAITVTAEDRTTKTYTVNFTIAPDTRSDAKQITAFAIQNQVGETDIKQDSRTITVTMPAGTNVTSLTPTITVSAKASVSPQSDTAQDFTNSVTYTVTAENETTQSYTVIVTVQPPSATAPTITTVSLPGGVVGTQYSQTLAANGDAPITWSIEPGDLPGGLALDSSTGTISGTPTAANTFTFTVKAANQGGNDTKELSIQITDPEPTVTAVSVTPDGVEVQKGGSQQFHASVTGTNSPEQTVSWSLEGSHASGTSISDTGLLTVASDEAQANLTVKATSTVDNSKSGTAAVTVTNAAPSPTYGVSLSQTGTYTFAAATENYEGQTAHRVTVSNSGNQPTGNLTVALSGTNADSFTLSGLSLSSIGVDGNASFTVKPNIGLAAGTYTAIVTVTGGNGISGRFGVSFTVNTLTPSATAPNIITMSVLVGAVGTPYSQALTATGTTPITWSVSEGSLPDGLMLSGNGVISGIPTAAGEFEFIVKAENSVGNATQPYGILIRAPKPTVSSVTVTPITANVQKGSTQQFGATVTGTNDPAHTVTWSIEGDHATGTSISNTGLLTVDANETAATLTVKATSTVDTSKSGTAVATVTNPEPLPTYGISLSQTGTHTFAAATAGYGEQTPLTVTVANSGSQPTGALAVGLSGSNAGSFTLSGTTMDSIAADGSDTFTVKPNTGLAAGTYTAIVTVTGGNGIFGSFTVSFTVAAAPVATHTITASAGAGGTISPSGAVTVNEGENKTFTITPNSNYRISQVIVDGVDQGAVAAYTFENVTANHRISVTFRYIGGSSGGSSGGDGGSSSDDSGTSSGSGSPSSGGSSTAPSTTTSTTAGENGTSTTTTQTTSKDSSGKTTTVTTEITKDAAGNATGSATTVTTDNITASTAQGSSTVTVKPDAAAIGGAAKAAGASETNPMDVSVAVPQDTVKNELQKADVNTVRVEVVIPKTVDDNPAVRTPGVTLEKETVDAARQAGKNVTVTVREETGAVKAVWSLDGQAMGSTAGQSTDLKLGVHTAPVQSGDPIAAPVKPPVTAAGQENGLVISLTADGTLLSAAKLTVPATNQTAITVGSTVALYRFDLNTGALRAVLGGVYSVDANGNVTIDVPAGTRAGEKETYVLLPVPSTAQPAAQPAAGGGGGAVHTVKAGDTLNQISRQYGCRVEDLLALNPGVDIYNLQIGSDLRVR